MRKSIIIIAVSKYKGGFGNLPGALVSGYRMAEWATSPVQNHRPLVIMDDNPFPSHETSKFEIDVYGQITTSILKDKVSQFLTEAKTDRLVVYFAGHGLVTSTAEQYWLLTNAAEDKAEGVDVEGFKLGLAHYNIGKFNPQLSRGQICLIADACRNTSQMAIAFKGDSILTKSTGFRRCHYDQFYATTIGERSFQANASADERAFCIFTSVLLDGLNGFDERAIEAEHHKHRPVVTNHRLTEYLDEEVPRRARRYGESMTPDPLPGFLPPSNDYTRIDPKNPKPPAPPIDSIETSDAELDSLGRAVFSDGSHRNLEGMGVEIEGFDALGRGATLGSANDSSGLQLRREMLENDKQEMRRALLDWDFHNPGDIKLTPRHFALGYLGSPQAICVPKAFQFERTGLSFNETFDVSQRGVLREIGEVPCETSIFLKFGGEWLVAPNYAGAISCYFQNFPGDIFLIDRVMDNWDHVFSDIVNLETIRPVRLRDTLDYADHSRHHKHRLPHKSVVAGYLYSGAQDIDNIIRTAHYMARRGLGGRGNNGRKPYLPIDLAILAADEIEWKQGESNHIIAFADLPAVEKAPKEPPGTRSRTRPSYARQSFSELRSVPCIGSIPVFRQAWRHIRHLPFLPPVWLTKLADHVGGRTIATISNDTLESLRKALDFKIYEFTEFSDPISGASSPPQPKPETSFKPQNQTGAY